MIFLCVRRRKIFNSTCGVPYPGSDLARWVSWEKFAGLSLSFIWEVSFAISGLRNFLGVGGAVLLCCPASFFLLNLRLMWVSSVSLHRPSMRLVGRQSKLLSASWTLIFAGTEIMNVRFVDVDTPLRDLSLLWARRMRGWDIEEICGQEETDKAEAAQALLEKAKDAEGRDRRDRSL